LVPIKLEGHKTADGDLTVAMIPEATIAAVLFYYAKELAIAL